MATIEKVRIYASFNKLADLVNHTAKYGFDPEVSKGKEGAAPGNGAYARTTPLIGFVMGDLPAVFQPGECAELEYCSVLLIEVDLLLDLLLLHGKQMIQIQFIAQAAKEGFSKWRCG